VATRDDIAPAANFLSWEVAHYSFAQMNEPATTAPGADPDHDGETNMSEFLSGTDPNNPASVEHTGGQELNISTRVHVETNERVGIAGFIISGSSAKKVVIRAIGPSLARVGLSDLLQDPTLELFDHNNTSIAFNDNWMDSQLAEIQASGPSLTGAGVPNALPDPMLELHDGNGNIIASNDNWKDAQQGQIEATGEAPTDDRESAVVITLPQGGWTAIVRGNNNMTGVGLIEIFRLR